MPRDNSFAAGGEAGAGSSAHASRCGNPAHANANDTAPTTHRTPTRPATDETTANPRGRRNETLTEWQNPQSLHSPQTRHQQTPDPPTRTSVHYSDKHHP
ncbi:hypothetical protein GCM10009638_27310 [Luteococcus sanguinis]